MNTLDRYINKFQKLRQGVTKYGPAPHKAVMLLSIIRGIELDYIRNNTIQVTPELVSLFKSTWNVLVESKHVATFALPFFHLQSEGFWTLHVRPGFENWLKATKSLSSFSQLQIAVEYAALDGELFLLLANGKTRNQLKDVLLETYFPNTKNNWNRLDRNSYFDELSSNVIKEEPAEYVAGIDRLKNELDRDGFAEEVFIRSGIFKREVVKAYNYSCCISGLRVDTIHSASLIDACHIVPFSESHDDTISNGLALCPTLHRAFDRHLIAIDDDYRVVISKSFIERSDSPYSIRQFDGCHVHLPANHRFYPGQSNCRKHRRMLIG